jgi:glycosyltransferase involved in cell wall biosynthesis
MVDVFTTDADGDGCLRSEYTDVNEVDGVSVQYFPVRQPRRLYYSTKMAEGLESRIAEFDVLHLHSIFLYPTLKAARCAAKNRIPYILAPRGMLVKELIKRRHSLLKSAWIALFERRTIEQAAAIHVTSSLEAEEIRKFGFSLPSIHEIPNGVEIPALDPDATRDPNTLLFLGRLDWKKGIERLISTMVELKDKHLIIAGNDEVGYTSKLMALSDQLGVNGRVKFVGPVAGEEKWRLYRQASVFVLPSYSENLANTVLEAMAVECPVIVTPEVGLAEVVERHRTGVVAAGEPASLANAVRAVLEDPKRALMMGRNGRRIVEEQYSWGDIAAAMECAYCQIIDEQRGRALA